jgi:hypothetical protein
LSAADIERHRSICSRSISGDVSALRSFAMRRLYRGWPTTAFRKLCGSSEDSTLGTRFSVRSTGYSGNTLLDDLTFTRIELNEPVDLSTFRAR